MRAGQLGIGRIGLFAVAFCWFDPSLWGRGETGKKNVFVNNSRRLWDLPQKSIFRYMYSYEAGSA